MALFSKDENLIYKTNYAGNWIKVFRNRVDFRAGVKKGSIPISQIASVKLSMIGIMKITLETTGGKKYKIPTLHKESVKNAIYQAQDQSG